MKKFIQGTIKWLIISSLSGLPFGLIIFGLDVSPEEEINGFLILWTVAGSIFFLGFEGWFIYTDYPKLMGAFVGIGFLIGIGYGLLILVNRRSDLPFWKIMSITGACLTSSFIIGKQNLDRLQGKLRLIMTTGTRWADSIQQKLRSCNIYLLFGITIMSAGYVLLFFLRDVLPTYISLTVISIFTGIGVLSALASFLAPISAGFLLILIWPFSLPFRITAKFDQTDFAERGLLLIGLWLTVLGILFDK